MRSPFTPPRQRAYNPVWSPDGRQVALYEISQGVPRIAVRSVDDTTPPRTLLENPEDDIYPTGWSPDGKTLLFRHVSSRTKQGDIGILAVDGKSTPQPVAANPTYEDRATFSPDGKWIAYTSEESGRPEVYVVAYPALGRRWPITSGGVIGRPDWISGTELGYIASDLKYYTLQLRFNGEGVEVGLPRAELGGRAWPGGPEGDGGFVRALNRFIIATPVAAPHTRAPLVLMTNWRAELEK